MIKMVAPITHSQFENVGVVMVADSVEEGRVIISVLQVLGGDLPALHPLPQLGLHLDPHLRRLARIHHRLPRPAVRVEGRELGQQGGRRGVHGEE